MKQLYTLLFLAVLFFVVPVAGVAQTDTIVVHHETTVCESCEWSDAILTTSGDYGHIRNVEGSIVVDSLHLTVNYGTYNAFVKDTCDIFTWYGQTYASSGVYQYEYTNEYNCPSVDTLKLIVRYSNTGIDEQIACDSLRWIDGNLYTSSTITPTYMITNVAECDSLVTLHLTINHPLHLVEAVTACESYIWHDSVYVQSGDYTFSHTDANSCTQVDTLHLTIHNSQGTATVESTCESYTWTSGTGATYTASGIYTYSHMDTNGCWQVDTLDLTIQNPVYSSDTVDECESYVWDNTPYTTSGDYIKTFTANSGCDSVVTLHLIIHNPVHTAITVTECGSYTWIANGQTYTTSGDYTYSHLDANGCTQVDTLHLTIYNTQGISTEESVCESYTWTSGTGATYTTSGIYTYGHMDTNGCWQVDTLNLTILSPVY